jgi:hypothetical protein
MNFQQYAAFKIIAAQQNNFTLRINAFITTIGFDIARQMKIISAISFWLILS